MSFDYSPPRWWGPVLAIVYLIVGVVALGILVALAYSAWQLLQAVTCGPGETLPAQHQAGQQ